MEHQVQPLPLEENDAGESTHALHVVCSCLSCKHRFLNFFSSIEVFFPFRMQKSSWDLQWDGDLDVQRAGAGGGCLGLMEESAGVEDQGSVGPRKTRDDSAACCRDAQN